MPTASVVDGAVRERVAGAYQRLSGGQRKVADALLEAPLRFAELPIDRLAAEIGVGTSAISRFARRLGFTDTRTLRLSLALDLGADSAHSGVALPGPAAVAGTAGALEEPARRAARDAVADDVSAIRVNLPALVSPAMAQAAALIAAAPRVVTVGYNSSGAAAQRLAMMLRRRGWRARAEETPADATWTQDLDPGDLVIAVTHRGSTAGIVAALAGI
ncbi:MAG TPA: hypothetical protein VFN74_23590, partial [Chloroflexota bacterium]|nr:hypothetical protein [Chloroflexota bacterium]